MAAPYRVVGDHGPCPSCGEGITWAVEGPDGVQEGKTFSEFVDAEETAGALNRAYAKGHEMREGQLQILRRAEAERLAVAEAEARKNECPEIASLRTQLATMTQELDEARRGADLLQQFSHELGEALQLRGDGTLTLSQAVMEKFTKVTRERDAALERIKALEKEE
jgi:hypothetical protein